MRYFHKKWVRNLSITLASVILFGLFPVSSVTGSPTASPNKKVIIVRDDKSGAVIYQNNRNYYYGMRVSLSQSIIDQGEVNPNEIIVKYRNPQGQATTQAFNSLADTVGKLGANTHRLDGNLGLATIKIRQPKDYFSTLRELAKNPNVKYAEPNYVAHITQVPNDPYYGQQWGPQDIHADAAWDKVSSGQRAKVTIAVLDTGINPNHEDLQGKIVPGYNFVNNNNNPVDGNGHGTHVSGIAAAIVNNGIGIAGIAGGSLIMPVKVINDSGSANYSDIINGIKYATDHGAQIISMSLGGPGASQALQDAVDYATSHGVTVVAASGNNNGPVGFPGNCTGVITVGAVDRYNQRASFSNFGPEMDVLAPGVGIFSSYQGSSSGYTSMSGTSMATPFVSGVVALIKAVNPNLSPAAVTRIIDSSATDLETPGFDNNSGYGLLNADAAVNLALKGQTGTPAPPSTSPRPVPTPAPVPSPVKGVNLALHKKAVASTIESSTRSADKAVDGDSSSRWASQPNQDLQYIYVDLGKSYLVNQIVLKWETAYAKAYRIYVSNDGQNWTDIYSTSNGTGGTNTLNLTGQGRYVLLYNLQRGTSYGYSLWELEVYGR